MLRVFGKNKLYLKNADVIEKMARIDTLVFDKTGTITHGQSPEIKFSGYLNALQRSRVKTLTGFSTHPLSAIISRSIQLASQEPVTDFKEIPGKGIQGVIHDHLYKIGSAAFVAATSSSTPLATHVYISIDNEVFGYFIIKNTIRTHLKNMLKKLRHIPMVMLSGDNDSDKALMESIFDSSAELIFNQNPHDKLSQIESLQRQGKKVLMVGDGLNDAGALKQSDVGLAITDDTGIFTPASDGILVGENLSMLDKYLALAKSSTVILKTGFAISFAYNAIALSFAVSGHLTPLIAAILMPVSSISVVGFSSLAVNFIAKRKLGNLNK
jgi:Cu+-exporting ATPase